MPPEAADSEDARRARLMVAAQAGDRASYAELLRDITPMLRRVAGRRWPGVGADHIEDVVQDTLLTLHAVRHTYDPARPFTPWLMAILKHRTADGARRAMRRSAHEVVVPNFEETFADLPAKYENDAVDERDALHQAISGLPAGQRRAVQLLKLKEMSLKEAAAETGMSVSALKVAMHRALKSLRAALSRDG
ncbi:MAG TPA: sigma-70 family RNA polymerase sigma factor [Magnetospirillum sp.]|nr:sigma-70 family RNA polymerase sigma factor [Magnetospirillum sp.]